MKSSTVILAFVFGTLLVLIAVFCGGFLLINRSTQKEFFEGDAKRAEAALAEKAKKDAETRKYQEEHRDEIIKERLDKFDKLQRQFSDRFPGLIEKTSVNSNGTLTIAVKNAWHLQVYQIRLQAAQGFQAYWSQLAKEDLPIQITDLRGNSVGGTGVSGAVWVAK